MIFLLTLTTGLSGCVARTEYAPDDDSRGPPRLRPTIAQKVERTPILVVAKVKRVVLYEENKDRDFYKMVLVSPTEISKLGGAVELEVVEYLKWPYAAKPPLKLIVDGIVAMHWTKYDKNEPFVFYLQNYNWRQKDPADYFYGSMAVGEPGLFGYDTPRETIDKLPEIKLILEKLNTVLSPKGEIN